MQPAVRPAGAGQPAALMLPSRCGRPSSSAIDLTVKNNNPMNGTFRYLPTLSLASGVHLKCTEGHIYYAKFSFHSVFGSDRVRTGRGNAAATACRFSTGIFRDYENTRQRYTSGSIGKSSMRGDYSRHEKGRVRSRRRVWAWNRGVPA